MALRLVYDPGAPFSHLNVTAEALLLDYFIYSSFVVYFILQNDLIHAWGLDMQLGYCAQAC